MSETLDQVPCPQTVTPVGRLAKACLLVAIVGLLLWMVYGLIAAMVKAPERERRIEACVAGMFNVDGGGPVKTCEGLDADQKRQASYEYMQRLGWL